MLLLAPLNWIIRSWAYQHCLYAGRFITYWLLTATTSCARYSAVSECRPPSSGVWLNGNTPPRPHSRQINVCVWHGALFSSASVNGGNFGTTLRAGLDTYSYSPAWTPRAETAGKQQGARRPIPAEGNISADTRGLHGSDFQPQFQPTSWSWIQIHSTPNSKLNGTATPIRITVGTVLTCIVLKY